MELVRLCTTFMLIRYHDVFFTALENMYLMTDFSMTDPLHFITVGAATPSALVKRSVQLNRGKGWEQESATLCWANTLTMFATSLACQRPLYTYNSFRDSKGKWRHNIEMTSAELDRQV